MRKCRPLAERFWEKVNIRGPDECWPWKPEHSSIPPGYGMFFFSQELDGRGNKRYAHRVAFFLTNGWWPQVVRHSCDNPPCCNPRHLLGGTTTENIRDCIERGRRGDYRNFGEANGRSKLTPTDVRAIRTSSESGTILAARHGVTTAAISKVRRGKSWKSVPMR